MIGLEKGIVKLAEYDENWQKIFENEKSELRKILGDKTIDIQHIGSTSVPGNCAKPIIDILIGVNSMKTADECIRPLIRFGYEFKGEKGIPGGCFFLKSIGEIRTHHLHIIIHNSKSWINHIIFRDFLIQNSEYRKKYCDLKKELAVKFKNDREVYTDAKSDFIEKVVQLALKNQEK